MGCKRGAEGAVLHLTAERNPHPRMWSSQKKYRQIPRQGSQHTAGNKRTPVGVLDEDDEIQIKQQRNATLPSCAARKRECPACPTRGRCQRPLPPKPPPTSLHPQVGGYKQLRGEETPDVSSPLQRGRRVPYPKLGRPPDASRSASAEFPPCLPRLPILSCKLPRAACPLQTESATSPKVHPLFPTPELSSPDAGGTLQT